MASGRPPCPAPSDNHYINFRRNPKGDLILGNSNPSRDKVLTAAQRQKFVCKAKMTVLQEAKKEIIGEGGNSRDSKYVVSRMRIQFGKYAGCSFKFLLENVLGYTGYLCYDMEKELPPMGNQ